MKKIRVLVVDDSYFMREFIASSISADPGIEVVGKASDPYDARDKIIGLMPDVVTLDVEMPRMNGIEFLRKLMPQYPLPVLVVSSASNTVFDALSAGAVDFVNKPAIQNEQSKSAFISELIIKVKIASIAKVGQYKYSPSRREGDNRSGNPNRDRLLIAIGASTGGTEAIFNVLKGLGNDLPGIVIVQHMPPVFTRMYSQRLNNDCVMEVKEAADGDAVLPGRVLIAPGDFQMQVVKNGGGYKVKVGKGEKVNGHCPSVDVLFDSVASAAGRNALGVILTGMGNDGAKGLMNMKKQGAYTIGQNAETCIVYGMPKVANDIGAVDIQLPLKDISSEIHKWLNRKLPE